MVVLTAFIGILYLDIWFHSVTRSTHGYRLKTRRFHFDSDLCDLLNAPCCLSAWGKLVPDRTALCCCIETGARSATPSTCHSGRFLSLTLNTLSKCSEYTQLRGALAPGSSRHGREGSKPSLTIANALCSNIFSGSKIPTFKTVKTEMNPSNRRRKELWNKVEFPSV